MMRLFVHDHGGKSHYLARRLENAGVATTPHLAEATVVLCDAPWLWKQRFGTGSWPVASEAHRLGIRVVAYPHGANVQLWPAVLGTWPGVACELVSSPGAAAVWRGFNADACEVGWMYGERLPFRPPPPNPRVTFAPLHHADPHEEFWNAAAQAQLPTNTRTHRGTTIAEATHAIMESDIVIGNSTFLHLAVALGCPAISVYEEHDLSDNGEPLPWRREYRYPIALDEMPLTAALEACRDENRIAAWRNEWIGGPLDVDAVIQALQGDGHAVSTRAAARQPSDVRPRLFAADAMQLSIDRLRAARGLTEEDLRQLKLARVAARKYLEVMRRKHAWRLLLKGDRDGARRQLVASLGSRPTSIRAWLALLLFVCPPLVRRVAVRGTT